jgi:type II secretory pathway component PulJ
MKGQRMSFPTLASTGHRRYSRLLFVVAQRCRERPRPAEMLDVGDVLNLDFSRLCIDDVAISPHDKPLFQCSQTNCKRFRARRTHPAESARDTRQETPRWRRGFVRANHQVAATATEHSLALTPLGSSTWERRSNAAARATVSQTNVSVVETSVQWRSPLGDLS